MSERVHITKNLLRYGIAVDQETGKIDYIPGTTIPEVRCQSIHLIRHAETEAVAGAALESLPGAIVAANSVDVDGVSGATLTSNRIKKAVTQCLEEANNA